MAVTWHLNECNSDLAQRFSNALDGVSLLLDDAACRRCDLNVRHEHLH